MQHREFLSNDDGCARSRYDDPFPGTRIRYHWRGGTAIYQVQIDDNFKFTSEDARVTFGTFATVEEALSACRSIVDRWLLDAFELNMPPEILWERYVAFGEDPFIVSLDPNSAPVDFSAWNYARERCYVMPPQGGIESLAKKAH